MRLDVRVGLILLLGLLPHTLRANTSVDVDMGWGERARPGGWTPLFIRVADPKPRNATIQLRTPHDSSMSMEVFQSIAIGPSPQTYVVYVPLINSYGEPVSLVIKDASTGKTLFDHNILDRSGEDFGSAHPNLFRNVPGNLFIGVSGRKNGLGALDNGASAVEVAFLSQDYLPEVAKGLDSLDILFLNQPDLSALRPGQQNAILDWVRAGGHLLLSPSEDPVPPGSALVRMLPCTIGDVITLSASPTDLRQANLPSRFAKFKARSLTPNKDAISIPLIGSSGAMAVRASLGLGYISVISFDTSELMFESSAAPNQFWSPMLDVHHRNILHIGPSGNSMQIQDPQRASAAGRIIDLLGNVPGVGSFGFKYVAMVLIAMMAIVGPIDWFLLKKMGRQQWTWVTTLGWISLITTGAIFIGSLFRSGDLHYRTLQILDQSEGAVVARTDVVGIYSPKTDDYRLDVPSGGWWEPITTDQFSYGRGVMQSVAFVQDGRSGGNIPTEMTVNVWNLRFLSSETAQKSEPILSASLSLTRATNGVTPGTWVSGTITNLGDSPLTRLWLRLPARPNNPELTMDLTRQANWPPNGLAPKGTLQLGSMLSFDAHVDDGPSANETTPGDRFLRYGPYGRSMPAVPVDDLGILKMAGNLSARRTGEFHERMNREGTPREAILYGLSDHAACAVKLADHQPLEKHWLVIRAMVPITSVP